MATTAAIDGGAITDASITLPEPAQVAKLAPNGLPFKDWRVGYPMGHEIPSKNDAATEALYDYAHATNLGRHPWASHLRYRGSVRVESIRIDDNRNNLCAMFLDRGDAEVLIQLDRDEIVPPDGVLQLVNTCTPERPVVSGIYFQRSLDNPYPHVYRHSHVAPNKWGEESRHSHRIVEEIVRTLRALNVPESVLCTETAFRLAQPDGTPIPESMRLLVGAFGGTGLTAIHATLLQEMKQKGAPYYPWFRERGEKGDMAFFNKVQALRGQEATCVDATVFAGHITESVVGLAHFWPIFSPAVDLADAHRVEKKISTVAVVIPTLRPETGAKTLTEVVSTSGMPAESIVGVIVADLPRRGNTRALNDGITAALNAKCDAVLLLDDDVDFPQQGWLRQLCDALEKPFVGAVGPSLECRGIQNGTVEQFRAQGGDPTDAPFLCGACELYSSVALSSHGQLEESLHTYHADTNSALMLRKLGWKLVWVHDVRVHHAVGASGFNRAQWDDDAAIFHRIWGDTSGVTFGPPAPTPPPYGESQRRTVLSVAPPAAPVPANPAAVGSSSSPTAAGRDIAGVPV